MNGRDIGRFPRPSYEHLFRLTDAGGLYEHANHTTVRPEHGYCVDDVARGLLVVAREPEPSDELRALAQGYLDFLAAAQVADGRFHNRRDTNLAFTDKASLDDCWGRALWGLGTAAAHSPDLAEQALQLFHVSAIRRSPWTRAMAFAALGAAEVLVARPDLVDARDLLADAADRIDVARRNPSDGRRDPYWRWPEARLSYANAILPETLLAAGSLLADDRRLLDGLSMLEWLLDIETVENHLSVTPAGGWSAGETRPGFDQQPIEVAALADACARAYELTGERRWRDAALRAADWFLGDNDVRTPLIDPVSGGGCDGLEAHGRNENQGAESTIAMLATMQHAHRLVGPPLSAPRR